MNQPKARHVPFARAYQCCDECKKRYVFAVYDGKHWKSTRKALERMIAHFKRSHQKLYDEFVNWESVQPLINLIAHEEIRLANGALVYSWDPLISEHANVCDRQVGEPYVVERRIKQ